MDSKPGTRLPSLPHVVGMLDAATAGVMLLVTSAPFPAPKSGLSEELLDIVATCLQSPWRKVGGLRGL